MRMICFEQPGSPLEVLECVQAPDPEPPPGRVRVRISARPVNPSDLLYVRGRYGRPPPSPSPVGFEAAGVVDACGAGAGPPPGTRVALDAAGTWQDLVVADPADLTVLPDDIGDDDACQMSINPPTAILLVRLAGLRTGQWLVQNAGASAVARMVTRLAVRAGVRCLSIVRSGRHSAALRELGATVIDASSEPVGDRCADLTAGKGAAVAFDAVGGQASGQAVRCLADGGRLVVYGLMSGQPATVRTEDLIFRSVGVEGFWLPERLRTLDREERADLAAAVVDGLRTGVLRSEVEARYPLTGFADAVRHATAPGRTGKILLTP